MLNGGYPDDRDYGNEILYTGFGGQESRTKKHVRDQEWVGANEGMRTNMAHGQPVRVIRGSNGERAFSPTAGYRYDGLYAVLDAWQLPSIDGPLVCRFQLVKTDGVSVDAKEEPPKPAPRVPSTVLRIVRDTAMANRVKELYEYACQVCGERLTMLGGSFYAEGAHIRPLGEPHDGPDVENNIMCLCPNHHVLFDRGAIYLTDDLTVMDAVLGKRIRSLSSRHALDPAHLSYHRGLFQA